MLIVGDSLNKQLHDALVASAEAPGSKACAATAKVDAKCHGHTLCPGRQPFRLAFARNDRLLVSTRKLVRDNRFLLQPWTGSMVRYRYDIVVLNKGVHHVPTPQFLLEYTDTLDYLVNHFKRALIIVRTTPAGHPDCPTLGRDGPLAAPLPPDTHLPFGWGDMAAQNTALKDLVRSHYSNRVVVMDVEDATSLRPDGHTGKRKARRGRVKLDCLHYRFPGSSVLEDWAVRFFNVLVAVNNLRPRGGERSLARLT